MSQKRSEACGEPVALERAVNVARQQKRLGTYRPKATWVGGTHKAHCRHGNWALPRWKLDLSPSRW